MRLTFIISIDPVKGIPLLNFVLHSLNLQTRKNFDVVFYNQTRVSESQVFAQLRVRPQFDCRFFSVERFLGNFPQAFSHVALVNTAYGLKRAEGGKAKGRRRRAVARHD